MTNREYSRQASRVNRKFEDKYFPRVKAVLKPDELIAVIKSHGIQAGINLVHATVGNIELTKLIKQLYLEVGLRFARINYIKMRKEVRTKSLNIETKGFGFNAVWTKFIIDYLQKFLLEKITFEVATTTRDQLLKVLGNAITEGLGVDEIVKRLKDLPFVRYQAARIVRTEINRASNVGSKAQSETFAYEQQKVWISAVDQRVRGRKPQDHASHIGLNGTRIDAGDMFVDPRNNDLLDHPGDPHASAESTINCRCQVAYVAKRDENGNLIPKKKTTAVLFPRRRRHQTITI